MTHQTSSNDKAAPPLSGRRLALLWAVLLAFVVAAPLAAMEVTLRLYRGVHISDDPYLFFGRVRSFFEEKTVNGVPTVQVAHRELYREREIAFTRKKGPGVYRVFCLGSSASAGWPHPPSEIYSAYLQEALQRAYPDRKIEVINVSAHGYPSYRVRMVFQEVIEFEPDAVIIYTGNNEFIEHRTYRTDDDWIGKLEALAAHSHLYRLVRGERIVARMFPVGALRSDQFSDVDQHNWTKIMGLPIETRSNPAQFARVQQHYEFGIRSMAESARRHGARVVLVTVPVNLRDWTPHASHDSAAGAQRETWRKHMTVGRAALAGGDAAAALRELRAAATLDPTSADTRFALARALEAAGALDEAYATYSLARDLDYNPFRAISAFDTSIKRIAAGDDNARLVDGGAVFAAASAPRAPGLDLFLDYVHPTKRGNLLLAGAIFDLMVRERWIGARPATTEFRHEPQPWRQGQPYADARDYPMQAVLTWLSAMLRKWDIALEGARTLAKADGAMQSLEPWAAKLIPAIVDMFPDVIDYQRRVQTGGPHTEEERRKLNGRLNDFFRTHFSTFQRYEDIHGKGQAEIL